MRLSRRQLLAGAAAAASLGAAPRAQAPEAPDPTRVRGRSVRPVGQRAATETLQRIGRAGSSTGTPHQDLMGIITPADLHFERHHAGVPDIDPQHYSLLVHGMVRQPMVFTLADLKRFPSTSRIHFVECSGNLARTAGPQTTPGQLAGLTSTSEWTGVSLATIFREVGVAPSATWFLAEGMDAAKLTRSIPTSKALDDGFIAYGQNGEPIRPEQGYPARLFLPGWEGNTHVKWLRRIEFADRPFMTREETSKYSEPFADGTARMFSFAMDARSLITRPSYPMQIERGWNEIQGIAWTGAGNIARVDISVDDGRSWHPAVLQEPVLSKAHTRFRFLWNWTGGETAIMSRAVDERGYVQPPRATLLAERGPGTTGYHLNPITAWLIRADGTVVYKEEAWG